MFTNKLELQLSARSVASILAHVFGPSYYDGPRFGDGDPVGPRNVYTVATGPFPDPWRAVALNPQPLPPRERYALALADAHIQEVLSLDRMASVFGGEVSEHALQRSVKMLDDVEGICPKWPRWPRHWPPPPPPPFSHDDIMTSTELFVFGVRLLAASDVAEQGRLRESFTRLGEKALGLSMQGARELAAGSVA